MQTTILNVAILPSDEIIAQAIAVSRRIGEEVSSEFTLNSVNLIPHITIYQAQYPNKNIDKLKSITETLSSGQELFEITLDAITVSHETFLFWNCKKSLILQNLQRKAVELANPLREGLIPSSLADVGGLSEGDRYDVKHFGALLIGSMYEPHITITRLKRKEDAEKTIKRVLQKKLSFRQKALILGYLGAHGTVTGIVENFYFK